MSRLTGNKRKLSHSSDVSSSSNLKETIALVESDILESHVDEVIDNYIHNIRNGNNPDLNRRAAALDKLKEKHIASADRHRKLQIKNINQLYEFEVEDAEALYARAYAELQEEMIQALRQEKTRLINLQKQLHGVDTQNISSSSHAGRALRSTIPTGLDSVLGNTNGRSTKDKASKKKVSGKDAPGSVGIIEVLPESAVKEDLVEIVRDMQMQADIFLSSQVKDLNIEVNVNEDCSAIIVEDLHYHIGEEISVFSVLSQETITGIITSVSLREIVFRAGNGTRFSVQLAQIASGRVVIAKERDILDRLRHIQEQQEGNRLLRHQNSSTSTSSTTSHTATQPLPF